jgi:hypothetical protein
MKITSTDELPRDATKREQHKPHEPPEAKAWYGRQSGGKVVSCAPPERGDLCGPRAWPIRLTDARFCRAAGREACLRSGDRRGLA